MPLSLTLCLCMHCLIALNLYRPSPKNIASSTEVPGLDYISRGYNIMFGNPHTTGNVDEGISGVIFDLMNVSNGETYKNYTVPNGVSVLSSPTCTEKFTFNTVTGTNSYFSSLTQDTSFDTKAFGAAFSASADYQSVYEHTTTEKSVFTSTYTQCSCYAASLNLPYDLPSFSKSFVSSSSISQHLTISPCVHMTFWHSLHFWHHYGRFIRYPFINGFLFLFDILIFKPRHICLGLLLLPNRLCRC